jgi:cellulose synthase/poly-beta-1,6-N-acetylglucosamine synthase-like glycosyltransferase
MLRAAEHFTDATVGFVASRYLLARPGSEGERAYMLQLARVRSDEAILDSPLGAHGAFYLFRRRLFRPFLQGTINDDFILPMEIVKQGYRGRYDNSIEAVELETTQQKQEFRRRVRIGAGNLQQSLRLWELVNCRRPWVAFMFLSGKGARPFMPLVGLLIFVATALLVAQGSVAATALLAAQATIIGVGLIGIRLRNVRIPKVISWLGYLIEGYSASVLGVIYYASQRRIEWRANASSQISNIKMVTIWPPSDQARPKILK